MAIAVNHRSRGSRGAAGVRGTSSVLKLCAVALCALVLAPAARAGSIFMKNGYIIQGPIVEFSEGVEGAVVLGWPNGKVTIYRRFVEKVDFEPGEEKNVRPADSQVSAIPEEVLLTPGVEEELPQSLPELVKLVKLDPKLIEGHTLTPHTEGPVPPPGDLQPHVAVKNPEPVTPTAEPSTVVKPPEADPLAPRATDGRWGFSLEPPRGWRQADVEGCVSWSGPAGPDGFSPSLNVTSLQKGALKWDEACRALREDQKIPLRGYRLLKEETFEVANRPAFRVAGRGESTGPAAAGRRVTVRQVLVEKGDRLWLISTFVGDAGPENLAEVLDRSVGTFQLDG